MYVPKDPTRTLTRWLLGFIVAWVLVCAVYAAHGQPLPRRNPRVQAATCEWLKVRLDYRETWGNNRGPLVDPIIRAGGGTPGQEWCGFTQAACQRAHGLPIPKNGLQGGARYWFCADASCKVLLARTFYYAGRRGVLDSIQPGDITGFVWRPSVIIHHVTRCAEIVAPLRKGRPPRAFYTLGGNEGKGTTAGLKRTYYLATSITAAARWDYALPHH